MCSSDLGFAQEKGLGGWGEAAPSARLVASIRLRRGGGEEWSALGCVQSISDRKKGEREKSSQGHPQVLARVAGCRFLRWG